MTDKAGYLAAPTATTSDLKTQFCPIFDAIAEGNVARERERVLPHEQVAWLNAAGFGTLRLPVAHGGLGASLEQMCELLADLAQADPNVSQIWRNHLVFVEDRLNASRSDANDVWIERFLGGAFVGGGWTEANSLTIDQLATTIAARENHCEVTGAKYYATGSLYATWLDVLGRGDDDELWSALVRADDPGVALVDDWKGFGQRTTASGSAYYNAARAEHGDVFPVGQRLAYRGQFYEIATLAVLAGIIRAALRDGIEALTTRKRNYPQALAAVPADDPQLLAVIGEVSAQSFAAQAALARSARGLDDVVAGRLAADDQWDRTRLTDAEVAIIQAKLVVTAAALNGTTLMFDALGASALSEELGLDRHWRNARTLASHSPRVYDARILGDWLTNGKNPVAQLVSLKSG
jgi:alkylation response protein AidB-like acyl-CoA dehydrogenase